MLCVVCVNSCCELVFLEDVVFWTLCARVGTLAVRSDSSGVHSSVVCIFSSSLFACCQSVYDPKGPQPVACIRVLMCTR